MKIEVEYVTDEEMAALEALEQVAPGSVLMRQGLVVTTLNDRVVPIVMGILGNKVGVRLVNEFLDGKISATDEAKNHRDTAKNLTTEHTEKTESREEKREEEKKRVEKKTGNRKECEVCGNEFEGRGKICKSASCAKERQRWYQRASDARMNVAAKAGKVMSAVKAAKAEKAKVEGNDGHRDPLADGGGGNGE